MIIANPIYDVVFKRLMENTKVAKFFISTLLEEQVESVEVKPQEFTYIKNLDLGNPDVIEYLKEQVQERLSIHIFRLDFIATIKTARGEYKKVLIEIQKAKDEIDLIRFRHYLAEQYKKNDQVKGEEMPLPITTIYILGFKLPEINSPCIKVERNYRDLINKTILSAKSDFVEKLTHDSFVIQVERITDRYQTRLDKLLSIFEQSHFIDDKEIIKDFLHEPDLEEVKTMTEILHHAGIDPARRKEIEIEQEAIRTIKALTANKERRLKAAMQALEEKEHVISQKDKAIEEKEHVISQKDKAIEEKEHVISQKDKAIEEKEQMIQALLKQLNQQK